MPVWIDGVLSEDAEARISAYDHGLTTGDGIFETLKVVSGQPFALSRHLRRLSVSARGLGLPEPDLAWIRGGIAELVRASPSVSAARLRITITGGVAPLGSRRGDTGPTVILALAPMEPTEESCAVTVVPWPRNERGALAGVKSTSYAENVVALQRARERGASEAIFGNVAGNLCEGTGSNVFCVHGGELTTPPLSAGCLAGVSRDLVLEWFGGAETDLTVEALAEADEAFLTSTGRDVQPIRTVDGKELSAAPGPVTRAAMEVFARESATNSDP